MVEITLSGELDHMSYFDKARWQYGPCEHCQSLCQVRITSFTKLYCACGERAVMVGGELMPRCELCKTLVGARATEVGAAGGRSYTRLTCRCGKMIART